MKWRSAQKKNYLADSHLLNRYQDQSDPDTLAILFDRYVELIFGVCLKYLKDPQESEDATMEIYELLAEKLKTHRVRIFRNWLYATTKNHCLQKLRKRRPQGLTEVYAPEVMHSEPFTHPEYTSDDALSIENGLMDCVQKLPAAQKQSIELFYFQSKSYEEIAALMTVDKGLVRSHLQNGRRNLRQCMDKKNSMTAMEQNPQNNIRMQDEPK